MQSIGSSESGIAIPTRYDKEMAYRDRLEREFGNQLSIYSAADGERLDIDAVLRAAAADAVVYVCGPERLVNAVLRAAKKQGMDPDRIRLELFS